MKNSHPILLIGWRFFLVEQIYHPALKTGQGSL